MSAAQDALYRYGDQSVRAPKAFAEYTSFGSPIVFDKPCRVFEVVDGTDGDAEIEWTLVGGGTGTMTELDLNKQRVWQAAGVASVTNVTKLRVYF